MYIRCQNNTRRSTAGAASGKALGREKENSEEQRERERGRRWTLAPEPRVSGVASRQDRGRGEAQRGKDAGRRGAGCRTQQSACSPWTGKTYTWRNRGGDGDENARRSRDTLLLGALVFGASISPFPSVTLHGPRPLPFPPRSARLSPPAFIIPGKTSFSFLLPFCVCVCVNIYMYMYVYAYLCAWERACVSSRSTWCFGSGRVRVPTRGREEIRTRKKGREKVVRRKRSWVVVVRRCREWAWWKPVVCLGNVVYGRDRGIGTYGAGSGSSRN